MSEEGGILHAVPSPGIPYTHTLFTHLGIKMRTETVNAKFKAVVTLGAGGGKEVDSRGRDLAPS